jgi:hypothetical protein
VIIYVNNYNQLIFVLEINSVFFEVGTDLNLVSIFITVVNTGN